MNDMSYTGRLYTLAASVAIMLGLFQLVVLSSGTLPDVKVARAIQAETRAAARGDTLVAVAQPASSAR